MHPHIEPTFLLTLPEVAKRLRCTVPTVRDYVRKRRLKAIKVGRQYLVDPFQVEVFLHGGSDDL